MASERIEVVNGRVIGEGRDGMYERVPDKFAERFRSLEKMLASAERAAAAIDKLIANQGRADG